MKLGVTALLALAVTVSCSDSPSGPNGAASGSLSFAYNGGTLVSAGSFSATGGLPTSQTAQNTTSWAAGVRDDQNNNNIGVIGSVPRAASRVDLAMIMFDRSAAGTSTIDAANCAAETCPAVVFWYNLSESQNATGEVLCGLETGTMTLATLSNTRATGSFSGTGSCLSLDDFTTETTFTVTNGSFDVPILSDVPGTGFMVRSR